MSACLGDYFLQKTLYGWLIKQMKNSLLMCEQNSEIRYSMCSEASPLILYLEKCGIWMNETFYEVILISC